jgi:hypothetical protein
MTERTKSLSRRNFLLTVGAGAAATGAAIGAKNVPQPQHASGGQGKRVKSGYQPSEHVSNYYRSTKI